MNFTLDATQDELLRSVTTIVDRHGRSIAAEPTGPGPDHGLEGALAEAGYLDLAREGGSLLDAALVTEAVARGPAVLPVGYRAIVGPLLGDAVTHPITMLDRPAGGVVRFGATAADVVVVHDGSVEVYAAGNCRVEPTGAPWGYPTARVIPAGPGRPLDVSPEEVMERWRIALAAEATGSARGAFDLTLGYVKDRKQFGRPIGSFQAVQHRLAELAVQLEGARLLTYHAAWASPDSGAAAIAATWALRTAKLAFFECHQLHGAIGFTEEYDLHRWTLRLKALGVEAGGLQAAAAATCHARLG
jgi:hypothetical protein